MVKFSYSSRNELIFKNSGIVDDSLRFRISNHQVTSRQNLSGTIGQWREPNPKMMSALRKNFIILTYIYRMSEKKIENSLINDKKE